MIKKYILQNMNIRANTFFYFYFFFQESLKGRYM